MKTTKKNHNNNKRNLNNNSSYVFKIKQMKTRKLNGLLFTAFLHQTVTEHFIFFFFNVGSK